MIRIGAGRGSAREHVDDGVEADVEIAMRDDQRGRAAVTQAPSPEEMTTGSGW
ncbi:MAG TPA: hypothetical protein VN748_00825 [Pseudonocardiaceae bacterium]|jgi:hypothetical protein|nr:hypothetical protein [Pseudonocardiaceae bacterium]